MTKNHLTGIVLCLLAIGLLGSCATPGRILYFQDIGKNRALTASRDYEPVIKKDDKLRIIVSAPNKDVVAPYNLTLSGNTGTTASVMPYLVDADGYINLPTLGLMHVEGMTRRQLEQKLTYIIAQDVVDPIVNVSFENYRITILGDVNSPGTYTMPSERTTILQALGMAGDLTLTGKRNNILLLRETADGYEYVKIDLRKTDILTSPYYYLAQNDVIYVAPSTARISSGTSILPIFASIGSLASIILAVIAIK